MPTTYDEFTPEYVDDHFTVRIDAPPDHYASTVRYVSAEAGTGFRYSVAVSPLPLKGVVSEGGPMLVTVTSPWVDAWAMQGEDWPSGIHEAYVREHLCGGPLRNVSDSDLRAMTLLVRHALNRE